jgi:hypothetical protein
MEQACEAVATISPDLIGKELRNAAARHLIARTLEEEDPFASGQVCGSLSSLISAQTVPETTLGMLRDLLAGLETASPSGRTNVCRVLGIVLSRVADPVVQDLCGDTLLGFMADDGDPAIRALAADVVIPPPITGAKQFQPIHPALLERIVARLVACLEDSENNVRVAAVYSLFALYRDGPMGEPLTRALEVFRTLVQDASTPVEIYSVGRITRLVRSQDDQVSAAAVEVARDIALHPDERISRGARMALDWVDRRK